MKWYTYDIETFAYDFLVVFKDKETKQYYEFHNDNEGIKEFIDEHIYCGFNTKSYDQNVLKAICAGYSPEEVKQVNDYCLKNDGTGWKCPLLQGVFFKFNNVDIRNDVYIGHSLKEIEGHLYMDIRESTVDFNIDRPLTPEEVKEVFKYCRHDVDATEKLTEIRRDYLQTKLNLAKRADVNPVKALALTNAKLTAAMLNAVYVERFDGRDYVMPDNIDQSLIPKEVLDFFNTIHDLSIPDEVLFKTSLTIDIGGMPCKFAWGGVHGSLTKYHEVAQGTRIIQNRDVSSLYPSLIEEYNYLSRNVPNPQLFYDIKKDRILAKHNGDKQTATDLKLPLNTVSGAQENRYNDLYDPLPTRSLRISGQLFLTMLAVKLLNKCKTIKLLNLNTDGLMYSVDKSELPIVDKICSEWEKTTRFELETDDISKVWIKDVNNLLLVKTNGDVKTVGSYLNYGISVKGAWKINNNMTIVKKALVDYFVKNIPVEETINNCNDIFEFQIIAKAGSKYTSAYHLVNGSKIATQKVNRVYASKDTTYGKLFKIHAETGGVAQIENLPDYCIIDNDNHLTIDDVDKTFYIELAKKRINDYLGIEPVKKGKKKMSETKTTTKTEVQKMNVFQKLLKARILFTQTNPQMSGKNMEFCYEYFELKDIVPIANPIFESVGLLPIVTMSTEEAHLQIINIDKPEDTYTISLPLKVYEGNRGTNIVQAFGSTITYYRRYLYMIALDICEPDSIDPSPSAKTDTPTSTPAPTVKTTKPLTSADGQASDIQIKQLKELLKKLKEKDATKEEYIAKIAVATDGFKTISRADCEKLTLEVSEMLKAGE